MAACIHLRFDDPVPWLQIHKKIFSLSFFCWDVLGKKQVTLSQDLAAEALLNEQAEYLGASHFARQSCMLPHDIMHSMYHFPGIFHHIWTGLPGDVEKYWTYNQDLASALGIKPSVTCLKPKNIRKEI